jgi:integrase
VARKDAITQTTIEGWLATKARPSKGQNTFTILGGLDLLISVKGSGRWRYRYRPRGVDPDTGRRYPQRSMTIGTTDTHTLKEAAGAVAELKVRVSKGQDPALADRAAAESERAQAAEVKRKAVLAEAARVTCRSKLEAYKELLASRGRSTKHQKEELAQVRLGLEAASLMDVAPGEIATAHLEKVMSLCPLKSRSLRFGALDRFLRWALRGQGAIAPTALFDRHERPAAPAARQRVLTQAEVAAVWGAASGLKSEVLRDLVHFLIVTPAREGEAACATWADIDTAGKTWTQPTSKNKRPHRFPLNDRALEIIKRRRELAGEAAKPADLVFPGPSSCKVFGGWSNLKGSLDARLSKAHEEERIAEAVKPWRFHDLRRTAATTLGELGHDDALVDMLLNHTAAGTRSVLTRTYNVSQRWEDRVRAMGAWSRWIGAALGETQSGSDGAKVIEMGASRRIA